MTHPGVSFVIPVLNNKARLQACLDAVKRQQAAVCVEVIVVDNGSTDGSLELARGLADQVLEVAERSPYVCRNAGIAAARGDLLILLDSNVVLDGDTWLATALDAYAREPFDVGVPRFEFDFVMPGSPSLAEFYSSIKHQDSELDVANGGASGACLLCDRQVFSTIGYFPVQRSNSDSVWTRSVTAANRRLAYVPTLACRYPAKSELQQKRAELRMGYGNRLRWLAAGDAPWFVALRALKHMLPQGPRSLGALVERRADPQLPRPSLATLWLFAWKMRVFRGLGRLGVRRFGAIIAD